MNEPVQPRRTSQPGRYAAGNRRPAQSTGARGPSGGQQRRPSSGPQRRPPARRRRRNPYAHLIMPCLILLLLLTVAIVLIYDYNSYDLELTVPENLTAEFGRTFSGGEVTAKLTGGIFGSEEEAKVTLAEPLDTGKLGQTEVTYRVQCDSRWLLIPRSFEKEVTKTVTVVDTTAPVITLTTPEVATNYRGSAYREEGFSAVDGCDGDVSALVTSEQRGDQVFYTVTDSSGNTATAVRDIQYLEGTESNGKTIYLTFDDGPSKYTPKLLEVLKKYNVKCTFFVVNTDYTHLISDIVADGHAIAVHSYSHELKKIYKSEDAFYADIDQMQDIIEAETGSRTNLLRFPGGSSNELSDYNPGIMTRLAKSVQQNGYYYFDWNVDSDDAGKAKTPEQVFNNVKNGIEAKPDRKNHVVLQHDIKEFSVDAVEDIILWGLENGYTFSAMDESSPGAHHKIFN